MALSTFDDKSAPPAGRDVSRVLGGAAPLWSELIAGAGEAFGPVEEVWGFAGAKFGWSLRVKQKERVLFYMTPQEGRFLVGIVLGEKAAAAAHASDLPAPIVALVDAAPRYAEGRGIRLPVGPGDDVGPIRRLVGLKLAPEAPRAGAGPGSARGKGGRTRPAASRAPAKAGRKPTPRP